MSKENVIFPSVLLLRRQKHFLNPYKILIEILMSLVVYGWMFDQGTHAELD